MTPVLNRRQTALGLACIPLLPLAQAQATADPAQIPIERFFEPGQLSDAQLSPTGSHVALCIGGPGERRRLVVLDLATMKPTPVASFKDDDVGQMAWVSDKRLIFSIWDERAAWGEHHFASGLFGVDADGENYRQLVARVWMSAKNEAEQRLLPWDYRPVWVSPSGRDPSILVARPRDREDGFLELRRLNTVSGRSEELALPPRTVGVWADHQGELRAAYTVQGGKRQLRWREGENWRLLQETDRHFGDDLQIAWEGGDGQLLVLSRHGRDTLALFPFDSAAGKMADKPLLGLAQFDLHPGFIAHEGRLLGLRVTADADTTVWLDDASKALQAQLDERLTATSNLLQLPKRGNSPMVLVKAYSDRRAGDWYAFHRETRKLTLLGRERPGLEPAQMSTMDYTPYKARDGRTIPAYLTLPRRAGKQRPMPLVVLVHGGPFVRGSEWRWDPEVQFLASRGYAVLQPEFRGSDGFGQAHLRAGFKQWGLAMQDDLADGARWAIAQGIADPNRIAIMGASYGGYAAMMGLVNDPDLYCCAVNWVGVTDLDLMFTARWSDLPETWKRHGMRTMLGDRELDADRLNATSPARQAKRITKPVLMAYGRLDERVPIQHGERLRDALKPHNPNVEWVVYDKEGHGFLDLKNRVDFYRRVEHFLGLHMPPDRLANKPD